MSFLLTWDSFEISGAKPNLSKLTLCRIPLNMIDLMGSRNPRCFLAVTFPRIIHLQYNRLKGSITQAWSKMSKSPHVISKLLRAHSMAQTF